MFTVYRRPAGAAFVAFLSFFFMISFLVPSFGGDTAEAVIAEAESLLGAPYRYGGTTPSGFDCSGFIIYLYRKYVPGLPRVSRNMADFGMRVEKKDLLPGDLVFFATGRVRSVITHVALYAGNGVIIHSVSSGPETGVIATDINTKYWRNRYSGAVRILAVSAGTEAAGDTGSIAVPEKKQSPWDSFDGYIEGDFNLYLEKDKEAFEEWKKNN